MHWHESLSAVQNVLQHSLSQDQQEHFCPAGLHELLLLVLVLSSTLTAAHQHLPCLSEIHLLVQQSIVHVLQSHILSAVVQLVLVQFQQSSFQHVRPWQHVELDRWEQLLPIVPHVSPLTPWKWPSSPMKTFAERSTICRRGAMVAKVQEVDLDHRSKTTLNV